MKTDNNGGAAFPTPDCSNWDGPTRTPGMSLRDWFATHASEEDLAAFVPKTVGDCADLFHSLGYGPKPEYQESGRYMVHHKVSLRLRYWARYKHADTMLEARKS